MSHQPTDLRAVLEPADDVLVEGVRSAAAIQDRLRSLAHRHAEIFFLRHLQNLRVAVCSSLYRVQRPVLEAIHPASPVVVGEFRKGAPSMGSRRAPLGSVGEGVK